MPDGTAGHRACGAGVGAGVPVARSSGRRREPEWRRAVAGVGRRMRTRRLRYGRVRAAGQLRGRGGWCGGRRRPMRPVPRRRTWRRRRWSDGQAIGADRQRAGKQRQDRRDGEESAEHARRAAASRRSAAVGVGGLSGQGHSRRDSTDGSARSAWRPSSCPEAGRTRSPARCSASSSARSGSSTAARRTRRGTDG